MFKSKSESFMLMRNSKTSGVIDAKRHGGECHEMRLRK